MIIIISSITIIIQFIAFAPPPPNPLPPTRLPLNRLYPLLPTNFQLYQLLVRAHGRHRSGTRNAHCCLLFTSLLQFGYFNPFTAMLAAPSFGKRPIKVPNLKSLRLFSTFVRAREVTSIKMHSIEGRYITGPSNIQSAGVCVYTF